MDPAEPIDSDEDLMLAYRDGDVRGFEALYRRFRGPLYRYLLRQLGEPAVAEALFADIWHRIIRARARYRPTARFKTYLFHLAHQVLIDHYRHGPAGLPDCYGVPDEPPGQAHAGAASRAVAVPERSLPGLLDALSEAEREAFLLKEEVGLSLEEIARTTDVRPELAAGRLRDALQQLQRMLRPPG